jgi:PAS domain S-box-containing protein
MNESARADILRLIALGRPLGEILDSICLLVEAQLQDCLCSIHVLSENGASVRLEAAPSLSPELRAYIADPDTCKSCRPIELCAAATDFALTLDVETQPDWVAFQHERSTPPLVRTCWSLPVLDRSGKPAAVIFGLYSKPVALTAESVLEVASLAYLCAIAIERDRRDAALLASNQRFELLDLVSPTGKFQTSWSGGAMTANHRWRELTGMTEDQAQGEGWLQSVHPEDRERVQTAWRHAVQTKSSFVAEYRLQRPGRPTIWVLGQTTPPGEQGYYGTILDITAQKAAEAAFRDSEERFRLLANNISQLAWMTDAEGGIVWYNQRWYEYTGTSFEEMAGWGWRKVHHPDHVAQVVERFQRALDCGEDWEDTFPLRGKDGQYRWFLSRAQPIKDSSGRVQRWFGTNTDVTELRELEAALQRQNEALCRTNEELSRFAYVASHDLQEPLRTISNYTQLIQRNYGDSLDEQAATFMAHVIAASKRLSSLITDLLTYSRASSNEPRSFELVDLHAVAARVVADCRTLIEVSRGSVIIGALPWVLGDETQLAQVFQNLISNGLKYRREGVPPEVRIECERIGVNYMIRVNDNGQGFNPEYAELIFGIFKRLHGHEISGTGMGLAICKAIVERHGGRIGAEGRPQEGATIWLSLPVPKGSSTPS